MIEIDGNDNIAYSGKTRALLNGQYRNRGNTNDFLGMRSHKNTIPSPGSPRAYDNHVYVMRRERFKHHIYKPATCT